MYASKQVLDVHSSFEQLYIKSYYHIQKLQICPFSKCFAPTLGHE